MNKKLNIFLLISLLILIPLVIFLDTFAIISIAYAAFLLVLISLVIDDLPVRLILLTYFIYSFLSTLLYCLHLYTLPDWFGLTGPYGGIGTDDSRYFAAITDNLKLVPWGARDYIGWKHWFSDFLNFIYPFPIKSPLQLQLFNLLGTTFIPYLSIKIAKKLNPKITNKRLIALYIVILFCPFLNSNSLIIMRESWVISGILFGFYAFLSRNNINLILAIIFTAYLRPASLGIMIFLIGLPFFLKLSYIKKFIFTIISLTVIPYTLLFIATNTDYGISGIIRQEFIETFIYSLDSNSTIIKIYQLPFPLNFIVLPVFFFLLPFPDLSIITNELFIPRFFLEKVLYPIYSIIPVSMIFAIFLQRRNRGLKLLIPIILGIIVIALLSLQPRHKTMIQPLLYIYAFTFYKKHENIKIISFLYFLIISLFFFI